MNYSTYRNVLLAHRDPPRNAEAPTGRYERDEEFFNDLKKCLLEILKELKITEKDPAPLIDRAIEKTFLGNKRRKSSESEASEMSHGSHSGLNPPNESDDMNEPQTPKTRSNPNGVPVGRKKIRYKGVKSSQ